MNSPHLIIDYTNHRGERAEREIIPNSIEFASTEWHPERQWLLIAYDCSKGAKRTFALANIHSIRNVEVK